MNALVVTLLVGTDHHPFQRLVDWADRRQAAHPDDRVLIQYGESSPPRLAEGHPFLTPADLAARAAASDVVITHGGPGTIMDVRGQGHRPLVLARDPQHGEHVDDHQLRFVAWAAGKDLVHRVTDPEELDVLIDRLGTTRDPAAIAHSTDETVRRLEHLVHQYDGRRLMAPEDATTVLFIGAAERSGATLMSRLVAELDGVVSLGAVGRLWQGDSHGPAACSCGRTVTGCLFWNQVGLDAFNGWDNVDRDRVRHLEEAVDQLGSLPRTARRHPGSHLRHLLVEYSDHYRRVYDAAREITGAEVIVDATGTPQTALAISHNRDVDLRVLHLIRDLRTITRTNPADPGAEAEDPGTSTAQVTRSWTSSNLAVGALSYRGVPTTHVRFEDLVEDPRRTVRASWTALGLAGTGELPVRGRSTVDLHAGHALVGRPTRLGSGPVTLRPDDVSGDGLGPMDTTVVALGAWPLLWRYGYFGSER